MKRLFSIILFTLLLGSISFAQQLNVHTNKGTDVYNLSDIDSITFTLEATSGTMTDQDGNVYQTVKIGEQWWMAENLKVTHYSNGDPVTNVTDDATWAGLSTSAYCVYDNADSNVSTYGLLYNWYAAVDSRNIAPTGWHVPTDAEWKELEMYLGMSQGDADNTNWRGTDEGSKLKNTSGWAHSEDSNGNGSNESGFVALPGGYRDNGNGVYYSVGAFGIWWSADEYGAAYALGRTLSYDHLDVNRNGRYKQDGLSIRLIKD